MKSDQFIQRFNKLYQAKERFYFIIDFEMQKPELFLPDEMQTKGIRISIQAPLQPSAKLTPRIVDKEIIDFRIFKEKFEKVQWHLHRGDTYLLNLTFKTPIRLNTGLADIFENVQAPYKILYPDRFLCFSPEAFIITSSARVSTFPMKGTADASLPGAKEALLTNKKEQYEHNTVVDLLRNDLSMIAKDIRVERYRYVEKITSGGKGLWQASSEITGFLSGDWHKNPAGMLMQMLPAGSVSGAPKQRTLEIIREVEGEPRGYYTGISGYFDGEDLITAVMIRFIEKHGKEFYYRSGGGITALSDINEEYAEYIKKIYLPVI